MTGQHRACPACGRQLDVAIHYDLAGVEVAQSEICASADCPTYERPPWYGQYQADELIRKLYAQRMTS